MPQRRHAAVILLGDSFQTFNALQAFQQSVQAVVNRAEIFLLGQLIEKTVEENEQFNLIFHDIQNRLGKEKAQ
jgi:regulator of replication initiation timing